MFSTKKSIGQLCCRWEELPPRNINCLGYFDYLNSKEIALGGRQDASLQEVPPPDEGVLRSIYYITKLKIFEDILITSTPLTTVFYRIPNLFPLFSPRKGSFTNDANFLRKMFFFVRHMAKTTFW